MKLIPGEFGRRIVDIVATACRHCESNEAAQAELPSLDETKRMVADICLILCAVRQIEREMVSRVASFSPAARRLYEHLDRRLERIHRAFSSTGLDVHGCTCLLNEPTRIAGAELHLEITLIPSEIRWRLRELARELTGRMRELASTEASWFQSIVDAIEAPTPLTQTSAIPLAAD